MEAGTLGSRSCTTRELGINARSLKNAMVLDALCKKQHKNTVFFTFFGRLAATNFHESKNGCKRLRTSFDIFCEAGPARGGLPALCHNMTEKPNAFGQHLRGSTVFTMVLAVFLSGALPNDNATNLTATSFFTAGGRLPGRVGASRAGSGGPPMSALRIHRVPSALWTDFSEPPCSSGEFSYETTKH